MSRILVTGASGNVGSAVLPLLLDAGHDVLAAVREPAIARLDPRATAVRFEFAAPQTFAGALAGVDRVFLMRPPHISDPSAFEPFIAAMEVAGVTRVVFLSLMGVERNPVVPHHGIEKRLRAARLRSVFLRPGFYMQNLSTTHLDDIRDRGEICVPAGNGATSFIDVRDIADAASVLLDDAEPPRDAYTITGCEALTYSQAAAEISRATNRRIVYTRPSGREFARRMREAGQPEEFVTVMRGIYLVAKLRMAGGVTREFQELVGRPPRTFREFADDHAEVFAPPRTGIAPVDGPGRGKTG